MIFLGLSGADKAERVRKYCETRAIRKAYILSPAKFRPAFDVCVEHEHVEWNEIIQYKFFYRLLQEIGKDSLVIVNECLRTQDRSDLTYNCIRHYLGQAGHRLIFQRLPVIDSVDDFMALFDFDTRSRWKREQWRKEFRSECEIEVNEVALDLRAVHVETDAKTRAAYAKEKRRLIDGIGLKDPHTIPRNLHLMSGKAKLARVTGDLAYVGRNNRFALSNMRTFKDDAFPAESTVFEFCHNYIDFSDWLTLSGQTSVDALVSDLKVDAWYLERYQQWIGRVRDAYAALHI